MPFDPERGLFVFSSNNKINLRSKPGIPKIYEIPAGRTLRGYLQEGSLAVDPSLLSEPIMERPTQRMMVAFNASSRELFAPQPLGQDTFEAHMRSLAQSYRTRRGRLGLTEVTGGMILGAPETVTVTKIYHEETGNKLPSQKNSPFSWIFVDMATGQLRAPKVARLGWNKSGILTLSPYIEENGSWNKTGAAIWIVPEDTPGFSS